MPFQPAFKIGAAIFAVVLASPAAAWGASPAARPRDPGDADAILGELHPDYASYIHAVRVVGADAAPGAAQSLFSGLVRSGGADPRAKADAPSSGRGARNDVVLFQSSVDPARSAAWRRMILDHEYFHARHLA
ncbi:MAG TPA: hypothetical protein VE404_10525, partial [Verrucomicrobiae bacterium]|nr:hypothetical protein [Verrucomicrobiae bacterium]